MVMGRSSSEQEAETKESKLVSFQIVDSSSLPDGHSGVWR